MIKLLIIILVFLATRCCGQCGRERPNAFYHNSTFVNSRGDTLNELDAFGFYEGLHLYTDNPKNVYNDTNTYTIGYFHHGQPVGEWKDHCGDGSFSRGQFNSGSGRNIFRRERRMDNKATRHLRKGRSLEIF